MICKDYFRYAQRSTELDTAHRDVLPALFSYMILILKFLYQKMSIEVARKLEQDYPKGLNK